MKRAINLLVFAVSLAALVFFSNRILRRDDSDRKYANFYAAKEEDAFDVLFFGTSHVLNGILPTELWRDYGFTSYNMGNNSEPLDVTEWVLRIALQYHKPKIAVFDVFYIDRAVDLEWTYPFRHLFFDSVPLSPLKVQALRATMPDDMLPQFLFPFILYHGRWDEMATGDFLPQVRSVPSQMGAEFILLRTEADGFVRTHEVADYALPGTQALRNIAAICRENGVQPVFICIPSPATREEQMNCNTVYALADELDVPFLHMLDVEGLVDFKTDCYDNFSHMNPDGALKVTHYLGQWLTERFDLPDHRGDAAYAHWNDILADYDAYYAQSWAPMSLVRP